MTEPQESPQPTEEPFDPGADEVETVEGCGLEVDDTDAFGSGTTYTNPWHRGDLQ